MLFCIVDGIDIAGIFSLTYLYDSFTRCGCNIIPKSTVILETCDPCAEFKKRMEAKKRVQAREA